MTRIFRKAGRGASGHVLRIRTANLTQRRRIEKPSEAWPAAYSFYDRLHSNIAQCVMLTRQHRSPKDRESLPYHERAQGERTSVPSSGVGADPHAKAHRGEMVLRAAHRNGESDSPDNSNSATVSDHASPAAGRVGRFRSIINDETGRV
ncbi:hypothetical protein JJE66_20930 [Bradyrhizobium diazoefficiens]|uniref:hypothetical protein n=1 Tax=Bradyrhizobium diazoefficiens TaxID=1355477 RepID=UPI00190D9064|nr:hypothetical protein [Bradyrhizobium diazoefficiens]MBK3663675.1 hypothetical protein [Bradyrhizobium diazoefficiens]